MLRNLTFVSCTIYSLQILASDQNKFLLFSSNFWTTLVTSKKPLLIVFWATFWEITGNVLENLEQLVESPSRSPQVSSFLAETYLRNAAFRYPETVFDWLHHQLHHSHLLFSIVSHPSVPRSCPFHSFFLSFLSFSFFDGQFSHSLSRLCPDKLWAWCDAYPHHRHIHGTDLIVNRYTPKLDQKITHALIAGLQGFKLH